jgi:hypothetical protein
MMSAQNIAGAAGACPVALLGRDCGCPNLRMTVRPPNCGREAGGVAVEVDEDPIAALVLQAADRAGKMALMVCLKTDAGPSELCCIPTSSQMTYIV